MRHGRWDITSHISLPSPSLSRKKREPVKVPKSSKPCPGTDLVQSMESKGRKVCGTASSRPVPILNLFQPHSHARAHTLWKVGRYLHTYLRIDAVQCYGRPGRGQTPRPSLFPPKKKELRILAVHAMYTVQQTLRRSGQARHSRDGSNACPPVRFLMAAYLSKHGGNFLSYVSRYFIDLYAVPHN